MSRQAINLVGQQFGEWLVLKKSNKKTTNKNIYWICQCSCGTIQDICGTDLRQGRTTKCKQHFANIEKRPVKTYIAPIFPKRINYNKSYNGKKFGKLTVIDYNETKSDGTYVLCQCDCGAIIKVRWNNLISGKTQSCGCLKSKGEEKICQILQNNNIDFKREVSFSDLRGPNNGLLRFDFGVYKNNQLIKLIEFQGEFHYQTPPLGWTDVRESDIIKQKYCQERSIPLLSIPYTEIDNITLDMLLGS